ncbi:MAG: hypothetical protein RIM99_14430 [Cyclobacteriaceae bacterium]
MASFEQFSTSHLYPSTEQDPGRGYLAYYLMDHSTLPTSINYTESWSKYIGAYLFLKSAPASDQMSAFIESLAEKIPKGLLNHASLAWLDVDEAGEITKIKWLKIGLKTKEDTTFLEDQFDHEILQASFLLAKESNVVVQTDSEENVDGLVVEYPLSIEHRPTPVPSKNVHIPLTGPLRGCLTGEIALVESGDGSEDIPDRGFYFFITKPEKPDEYLPQYYPLFSKNLESEPGQIHAGYQMSFDPLAPYNPDRTYFNSLGFAYGLIEIPEPPHRQIELVTGSALAKQSGYSSIFGKPVSIAPVTEGPHPGGYVLCQLPPDSPSPYYMAPHGDFEVAGDSGTEISFACGLSGMEFFKIKSEDGGATKTILRFSSHQPACIKKFPFELASPVGPPSNPTESPFSDDYKTSWATILTSDSESIPYISQPKGAALYGKTNAMPLDKGLLGHVTNPFLFTSNENDFFPMLPYAGLEKSATGDVMSDTDMQTLEATVLSKQRHATISMQTIPKAVLLKNLSDTDVTHYATTPAGLLVKSTQSTEGSVVRWDQFLLAKNGNDELAFNDPPDEVISAMQSSNVFLVVSNSKHLEGFSNIMGIGDWKLKANIGEDQTYGDYRNLMILKGRKGKLYDSEDVISCLVANPKKWNQTEDFSIPQTKSNEDPAQLIILSNWLQEYFQKAHDKESDDFTKFNTIATDENWTGILFLRLDIDQMPNNLSGIVAGVTDHGAFNAHHLGIEITPIQFSTDGIPDLSKPSSLFGLINYQDPDFSDKQPVAIAPASNNTYDFRLLSLKVLFENTAVKSFESYAQLTVNQLFGSSVSKTYDKDNVYKNVLLAGSLQINNGQPVYSLSSQKEDAFYLESNIINKVEITEVYLSNRSLEGAAEQKSWFGLSGFIDFNVLGSEEMPVYDLFSFGNTKGEDKLRKGLHFSNLGIGLSYHNDDPGQNTLSFSTGEVRFDPSPNVSTPRPESLYLHLALTLENMVVGNTGQTPKDKGYLDVISEMKLNGPGQEGWYGLRFKLNMGSPGALEENASLNAHLLLSWSPFSQGKENYQAGIGIALPGSGGNSQVLSLQSVLKLSIGQILLRQVPANGGDEKSFMLLFTEIALKFMGLLKIPPSGNTLFYLFGNPEAQGDASALGWYAMYRKEKPGQIKSLLSTSDSSIQ